MKPSTRCVIIVNPTSGREKAPRYIPYMTSVLSEKYEDVTIKLTQKAGDAKDFARYAAEKNKDIFCMGGDGTINEVINGMVSVQSESCFGFVPFGTVNDLSRALHMPRSPKKVIDMFRRAEKVSLMSVKSMTVIS
ncbi:MAG: acylglycerol kinase family protein [Dialister sp.]